MDRVDAVDRILGQWGELPRGDVRGRHVIWRIQLAAKQIDRALEQMRVEDVELAASDMRALMLLRVGDPPRQRTPTQLGELLRLSSGAMTSLVDRLERAGYVIREPDPSDRRGVLVSLTAGGERIALALHERYVELERELLTSLSAEEQETLAGLLRKLLLGFEGG